MKPGIRLLEESEGTGPAIKKGDRILVRLNGWLTKGECIQEDYEGEFTYGSRRSGQLIAGITYSLAGMRQGGKRKVRISPHLAYRDAGVKGRIPPNAVLIYEIELLRIVPGQAAG